MATPTPKPGLLAPPEKPKRMATAHGYIPPEETGLKKLLRTVQFWSKALLSTLLIILISLPFCILGILLRPFGPGFANQWALPAMCWIVRIVGCIRFKVDGAEYLKGERPCVYVTNHQSTLDMCFMGAVFPSRTAIVGKKQVAYIPFIGWYFWLAGNFLLDRGNRDKALGALAEAATKMAETKTGAWIYPEGTRSYTRKAALLEFKKGSFRLAIDLGCPIVPVVFAAYPHVYDQPGKRWPGGTIRVRVMPPIETKGFKADDTGELMLKTREDMLRTLKAISGRDYARTIVALDIPSYGQGPVPADSFELHEIEDPANKGEEHDDEDDNHEDSLAAAVAAPAIQLTIEPSSTVTSDGDLESGQRVREGSQIAAR